MTDAPRALPDIDFATFVLSLASSVLVNLGEMENPDSGRREHNLALAKQTVDILAMLEVKTRGNLTPEEEKLIQGLLYDLRIKYVDAHKRAATGHAEAGKQK